MSRKLDDNALAFIENGNSETVFEDIVRFFDSSPKQGLWEIELLGKSHPLPEGSCILVDGNSIGIPKLQLVQAFIFARKLFLNYQNSFEEHCEDVLQATSVMLLMDPEYLTAANARKRIIKSIRRVSTNATLEVALKRELLFIDSVLTSPLHRHSKSPTLWSHRRWLFTVCCSIQKPCDVQRELTEVVMVAAERHPRNYYAWLQMRWILETCAGVGCTKRALDGYKSVELDYEPVLIAVQNWCLRHPGDTSGWSFLLFVLFAEKFSEDTTSSFCPIEAHSSVFQEVLWSLNSFKWTHESIWVFLKTLAGSGSITEVNKKLYYEGAKAAPSLYGQNPFVR